MDITLSDLYGIIKYSSNCKRLVIRYCKINASEALDSGKDIPYQIKELSFYNSSYPQRLNWKKKKHKLVYILQAIKNSRLLDSVQKICLKNEDINFPSSLIEAQKIAKSSGLNEQLIVYKEWEPVMK